MANPTEEEILVRGVIATMFPEQVDVISARSDELLNEAMDRIKNAGDDTAKAVEMMAMTLFMVRIEDEIKKL